MDQNAESEENDQPRCLSTEAASPDNLAPGRSSYKPNTAISQDAGDTASQEQEAEEHTCWICFGTEEDDRLASWVQPCKCRGATKWVHKSCLNRWIDEKQKGDTKRAVICRQCQTQYLIMFPKMGKIADILESIDFTVRRSVSVVAGGIFVCSVYWSGVLFGAISVMQVVGYKRGLELLENGDPFILLLGLPSIPIFLCMGRLISWDECVLSFLRNHNNFVHKLPVLGRLFAFPENDDLLAPPEAGTPNFGFEGSTTRFFCGALALPTISCYVGRFLFNSFNICTVKRAVLGGLTYLILKGLLKIYLRQQQYIRKRKRHVVDFTEENLEMFHRQNERNSRSDRIHIPPLPPQAFILHAPPNNEDFE